MVLEQFDTWFTHDKLHGLSTHDVEEYMKITREYYYEYCMYLNCSNIPFYMCPTLHEFKQLCIGRLFEMES